MGYDVRLLPSTIHILLLQISCGALLCQALLVLVHVLLLLVSFLLTIPLHYLQLDLHLTTYGTSLLPYTSSSTSASIRLSLILRLPSLSLFQFGLLPPCLGLISKIRLLLATKMAGLSVFLGSGCNRPSRLLTS